MGKAFARRSYLQRGSRLRLKCFHNRSNTQAQNHWPQGIQGCQRIYTSHFHSNCKRFPVPRILEEHLLKNMNRIIYTVQLFPKLSHATDFVLTVIYTRTTCNTRHQKSVHNSSGLPYGRLGRSTKKTTDTKYGMTC